MLTKYERLGASSRLRFEQYLPYLTEENIQVTRSPLFSEKYIKDLQHNKRSLVNILNAYMKRINTLLCIYKFDLIWIEKESLPWLPTIFEIFFYSGVPYILDYDDAVFHYYDQNTNPLIKFLLTTKHPVLMKNAAIVIAGNNYIANFAKVSGAKNVQIIPTVVDMNRYKNSNLRKFQKTNISTIGWVGQRATSSFLYPLNELFQKFSNEGKVKFVAVGIDAGLLGLEMESLPWQEETEVDVIRQFDIGIMPLSNGLFERGKCGYKLIQYMACELPVIASPVGINCEIIEHGVNGFLAESSSEWEVSIRVLLNDSKLRKKMGCAGREKVEKQYSLEVTAPKLVSILKKTMEN